jgi:hypothetical protein
MVGRGEHTEEGLFLEETGWHGVLLVWTPSLAVCAWAWFTALPLSLLDEMDESGVDAAAGAGLLHAAGQHPTITLLCFVW